MARILAISSQVARGHVGLSAITPALTALGHEVIALPTVLLSNHPGHPRFAGDRVAPGLLRSILDALAANGWLGSIDAVLTGYLPSAEHVAFAREAVARVKAAGAGALYLCDPVIGDAPKGVYIADDAAAAIREQLVPAADLVKLNHFELGWLASACIGDESTATAAVRAAGWPLAVVTSVPAAAGTISNLLVEQGELVEAVRVPVLAGVPKGTGDLLSALLLGHRLGSDGAWRPALRRAVAALAPIIEGSIGEPELALVAHLRALAAFPPKAPRGPGP